VGRSPHSCMGDRATRDANGKSKWPELKRKHIAGVTGTFGCVCHIATEKKKRRGGEKERDWQNR